MKSGLKRHPHVQPFGVQKHLQNPDPVGGVLPAAFPFYPIQQDLLSLRGLPSPAEDVDAVGCRRPDLVDRDSSDVDLAPGGLGSEQAWELFGVHGHRHSGHGDPVRGSAAEPGQRAVAVDFMAQNPELPLFY